MKGCWRRRRDPMLLSRFRERPSLPIRSCLLCGHQCSKLNSMVWRGRRVWGALLLRICSLPSLRLFSITSILARCLKTWIMILVMTVRKK
uniref:Uncharacterized protein n=1 Tax=Arundo donax TaxID=35708 RepID=A0A0A9FDV1_ARUDO